MPVLSKGVNCGLPGEYFPNAKTSSVGQARISKRGPTNLIYIYANFGIITFLMGPFSNSLYFIYQFETFVCNLLRKNNFAAGLLVAAKCDDQ